MNNEVLIGQFDVNRTVSMARAHNGGWVVQQDGVTIGAYTTPEDMLKALARALVHNTE